MEGPPQPRIDRRSSTTNAKPNTAASVGQNQGAQWPSVSEIRQMTAVSARALTRSAESLARRGKPGA